jgi:O-antigen ligase
MTNVKIPIGQFGFTFADAVLLILLTFLVLAWKTPTYHNALLFIAFMLFIGGLLLSILGARFIGEYFINLIPYFYIVFLYFIVNLISSQATLLDIKNIKAAINISLLLSYIPLYLSLVNNGVPDIFFMDTGFAKYRYLCSVSNQYDMYVFCLIAISIFLSLKFYRRISGIDYLIVLLSITPILYSGSRSGTLMIAMLFLFMVLVSFFQSSLKVKLRYIVLAVLVVSQIARLNLLELNWNIQRALSFMAVYEERGLSVDEWRLNQFEEAMHYFYESPIVGLGIGNYVKLTPHEIHNTYLSLLVETGILGFTSYALLLLLMLGIALKHSNNRTVTLYIIFFFLIFLSANYSALIVRERWVWIALFLMTTLRDTPISRKLETDFKLAK